MTLKAKRQTAKASATSLEQAIIPAADTEAQFDPSFLSRISDVVDSGLNPSSALALITRLIAEIPQAPKETMDRIKMVDKLLNTARAMMETRLKNEEAATIATRLDEMERMIEKLAIQRAAEPRIVGEIWDDR